MCSWELSEFGNKTLVFGKDIGRFFLETNKMTVRLDMLWFALENDRCKQSSQYSR